MSGALAYLWDMLPMMLAALPLWAAMRGVFLRRKKRPFRPGRELMMAALILWCAGLAGQTLLPDAGHFAAWGDLQLQNVALRVNLIPFHTIRAYIAHGNATLALVNLVGNVVVFIPLGLLPPLLWERWRNFRGVLLPVLCSLGVELTQIFTGRSVDVDDLILNTLGGLLGWLLALAVLNRHKMRWSYYFSDKKHSVN